MAFIQIQPAAAAFQWEEMGTRRYAKSAHEMFFYTLTKATLDGSKAICEQQSSDCKMIPYGDGSNGQQCIRLKHVSPSVCGSTNPDISGSNFFTTAHFWWSSNPPSLSSLSPSPSAGACVSASPEDGQVKWFDCPLTVKVLVDNGLCHYDECPNPDPNLGDGRNPLICPDHWFFKMNEELGSTHSIPREDMVKFMCDFTHVQGLLLLVAAHTPAPTPAPTA